MKARLLGTIAVMATLSSGQAFSRSSGPAPSQTVFTSTPNPSSLGQTLTLTAVVSGSGPVPTGTVGFSRKPCSEPCAAPFFTIGTATLNGTGKASLVCSSPSLPGTYEIVASYSGDGNYNTSFGSLDQNVVADVPVLSFRSLLLLAVLLAGIGLRLQQGGRA